MASLNREQNGNYTIQVVCGDGKRRSIRLGKIAKKLAESIKLKVEHLNAHVTAKLPMDSETAQWVGGIGDELAAKLAAAKLLPPRESCKLGEYLNAYLERRKADSKGATVVYLQTVVNDLTRHFGENTDLRDVTEERADAFRTHYLTRNTPKLAAATVARRLKAVRMIFKHALRMKLIALNPFAHVKAQSVIPEDRLHYAIADDVKKLIAVCNPTWRILLALCRFGGLRCPSEVLSIKWSDVNWETCRMTIPSCKTEHIPGKAYRVAPIFSELRPYLEEAFELAADGAEYVVSADYRKAANLPGGWKNCNLRTQLLKLIRRAGLKPWPRLFQNLRSSCETDLVATHPLHVVCGWIGNTPRVALKHYLQTTDSDFDRASGGGAIGGAVDGVKAVQSTVQPAAAAKCQTVPSTRDALEDRAFSHPVAHSGSYRHEVSMGAAGLEPARRSPARGF